MSGSPTRAKIAIGDVLGGAEPGLRVQACLLYRVLDEDEEFNRAARLHAQSQDEDEEDEEPSLSDYWEWWELVGPNRHDYWVEVDHGSWRTSVYEPLPATDVIDPTGLQVGQHVTLTGTMAGRQAVVTERRLGRVSQVTGQPTYPGNPRQARDLRDRQDQRRGQGEPHFQVLPGTPAARLPQAGPLPPEAEAPVRPGPLLKHLLQYY